MKLIVCLDERNGMLFGGRRQSRDAAICTKILQLAGDTELWMNAYSGRLFEGAQNTITIDTAFLEKAQENDFCFVENVDITQYLPRVQQLIIFRWNRHYPADVYFPDIDRWNLITTEDFPGNSHEKITMEVYSR